ncbi:TniB family NTP-binding protein [Shinella sp.]|uniref:TniB family NTP-binding protein n=1 Tax=Shinella sp. TaxID=1870904 RepID=UPI00289F6A35|nr:TniB family NTP-binding protein [Shinella sp.]
MPWFIRFLANDLKVPMICAGTDLARQAILTDQHDRRRDRPDFPVDRDRRGRGHPKW